MFARKYNNEAREIGENNVKHRLYFIEMDLLLFNWKIIIAYWTRRRATSYEGVVRYLFSINFESIYVNSFF